MTNIWFEKKGQRKQHILLVEMKLRLFLYCLIKATESSCKM